MTDHETMEDALLRAEDDVMLQTVLSDPSLFSQRDTTAPHKPDHAAHPGQIAKATL